MSRSAVLLCWVLCRHCYTSVGLPGTDGPAPLAGWCTASAAGRACCLTRRAPRSPCPRRWPSQTSNPRHGEHTSHGRRCSTSSLLDTGGHRRAHYQGAGPRPGTTPGSAGVAVNAEPRTGRSLAMGGIPRACACADAGARSSSAQTTLPPDTVRKPHLRDNWATRQRPRPFSSWVRALSRRGGRRSCRTPRRSGPGAGSGAE